MKQSFASTTAHCPNPDAGVRIVAVSSTHHDDHTPFAFDPDDYDPDLDALEQLSNSVVDLIEQGRIDDAVEACVELKRRYPDQMDWIFRTAEVHEANGEADQAIEHYRQCIAFIDTNPDGFDAECKEYYLSEIDRLKSRKR